MGQKKLKFETDREWHAHLQYYREQRAQYASAIEARGFTVRYRKCDRKCSECPHPRWLMPNGSQLARPKYADFRAAKVYKTEGLIALAAGMHSADMTLRELAQLQKTAIGEAERITRLCQATMRNWISLPVPAMAQRFHQFWIAGSHCATPLLAIACAHQAVSHLVETLAYQNLQYNKHANLTRRGLRRQGALALEIKDRQAIMPPTLAWRIAMRGHHGHWRLFRLAPLGPKGPDGQRTMTPVPEHMTKRFIRLTGNREHMDFYMALQQRLDEIEAIRNEYSKFLGQWRADITLSPKAVDKRGEKSKTNIGKTLVGSCPNNEHPFMSVKKQG